MQQIEMIIFGIKIFAVDWSKINLPRPLLEYSYPTPSDNAYYPQELLSSLYQLKSNIPVDFDLSAHYDERVMAQNHLRSAVFNVTR